MGELILQVTASILPVPMPRVRPAECERCHCRRWFGGTATICAHRGSGSGSGSGRTQRSVCRSGQGRM